jgi:hypothetical protein
VCLLGGTNLIIISKASDKHKSQRYCEASYLRCLPSAPGKERAIELNARNYGIEIYCLKAIYQQI